MADSVSLTLTPRRVDVLRAISAASSAHGHPPTYRELADRLGIKSTNGIAEHLVALQRLGLVRWSARKGRTLTLTPSGQRAATSRAA